MKLLEKLEGRGYFTLPEKRGVNNNTKKRHDRVTRFTSRTDPPREDRIADVRQLKKIQLEPVFDKPSTALWKEYMNRYHYLGDTRPFGFYMRYFIKDDEDVLGCILLSAAARSMTARDEWIGWSSNRRLRNLAWLVNNTRFLIFPWVKIKNLASFTLGHLARRVQNDWLKQWGYEPVLLETFVDGEFYKGTCYKAANWQYIGMTTGMGLPRVGKTYTSTPKMIYMLPLIKNFRSILCAQELSGARNEI